MNKTLLRGILLVYGTFVAVDMFIRMRDGKPILQSFLESALIPVHVTGTLAQILVVPAKWGTAGHIIAQMGSDLFDPEKSPAEDVEIGYDALVLLARDTDENNSVAPMSDARDINSPEIVQQVDKAYNALGYGMPQYRA